MEFPRHPAIGIGAGLVGAVAVVLLLTTDPIDALAGAIAGVSGSELVSMALNCQSSGCQGSAAGAGGSGAAGAGGSPSGQDMAEDTAVGVGTDAATEAAGEAAKGAGTKAGWGIIGTALSLLTSGPTIYEGVMSSLPNPYGDQGMGKENKGYQKDMWRARNPDKPISEFPGHKK